MQMRDVLRKMRGGDALPFGASAVRTSSVLNPAERLAMLDAFEANDLGWFWSTDAQGRVNYLSANAAARFGDKDPHGVALVELLETVADDGETAGERPLNFFLSSHTRFHDLMVRLQAGKREEWWQINGRPHVDDKGNFIGFRGSAQDISEQFLRQRDQLRLAKYDTLTGLANRHFMQQRIDTMLSAFNQARRSCALIMLDLDKFKKVNDTLGHPAGDELLRQVAQRLRAIVLSPAEIARLGGDEFQILIPDMDDRGHLGDLAQKIIQMLSQPYALGEDRAVIGASLGIAIAPYDGITREELVKSADLALYASKGGGRGQYRFYASDLATAAQRQREIGEDLRGALENDELAMHYQPIVRAADNTVVAFEALLRWEHPEQGPISPAVFVPLADELNLTTRLGEWTLRRACREAAQWPGDIRVSVNITPQLFFSSTLLPTIEDALESSGLRANRLELEVSEALFLGEATQVDKIFARLVKKGVRLTLDDFGKGYSSLSFLRRAPFEKIKIDHGFINGCTEEGNSNAAIITAIVSLARALDMETTAAGVEAMDQLRVVLERGVSHIQGFVYSRPVPQDVVLAKLSSGDFIYEPSGPEKSRAERRTVFRRIGVIHEDHRYEAMLRNISRTGALIEGLLDVPVGTDLVLDLGGGQLAVASVRRSHDATQGVQFEQPLISDGANGLCTRHRVSPHQLAAAGMPLARLEHDSGTHAMATTSSRGRFIQVDVSAGSYRAG